MTWTHSICGLCWAIRCINAGQAGRVPVRVTTAPREQCCFCGDPTTEGIYVRHDPRSLGCVHWEVHEQE